MSVSVYLFTGFLEAGKTKFIQETLENIGFCTGEPTLLLVCEEGELEYDPARFANGGVTIGVLESKAELNRENLERLRQDAGASRVVIEYNGMWTHDELFAAMPEDWRIFREMLFADARSFTRYNSNMRQLVYDKLKWCIAAVFNRPDETTDKAMIHKIVRAASRTADIVYQYPDGSLEYDRTAYEPAYDLAAPVVEISDADFADWARDISDDPAKFEGKTLRIKGTVVKSLNMGRNEIGLGRYVMVCCEEDVQFVGFFCTGVDESRIENGDWITLTGRVRIEKRDSYAREGAVFECTGFEKATPPEQTIATFY